MANTNFTPEQQAFIDEWERTADCRNTPEMVCPHCFGTLGDSWAYEDDEGELACPYDDCGKVFSYERRTVVTYSTSIPS
ncbi:MULTISPECIES: hypothetical protein [unclassified Spirosoma]|uniref:hypothetical protein n=1 Tax=unclassified Spirosoma TaxID=2621999 RepID=UPI00095EDD05|nr:MULTISPECIES: hypothetical protein [unclassified Spirosoma]MBN8821300.1 hypothetical protein [Spirosoma sp.]OJW78089.1 MAG: hypothetical protein BGO59_29155 [Spirosoma sp. 48-14]